MQEILRTSFLILAIIFVNFGMVYAQDAETERLKTERRDLMPVPASVNWKSGRLPVSKTFSVAIKGQTDERLKSYIFRVMRRLEGRTILELPREYAIDASSAQLLIETQSTGNAVPKLGDDESYNLEVTDRQAVITAPTTVGAMRGLETFLQLLESDREGFYFPAVSIQDKPRFAWRGLMIDSARHFQPMEVLKRNIDAMAAVKLNVLHWHLTEDQGFRIETKKFPELHQMGSDGLFYTQDQAREIIRYAADRGIRVMPEFDMPGHATAWLVSHPEIGSGAPGATYTIERRPGIFDPTLDPTNEKTYKLLKAFFKEMAALFPDAYMHIGGDENEGKQWNANPKIQAFMKKNGIKDNHALQTYFNKRLLEFLQKDGKIMMGWDEIFQPDLPKDVVIHSWRGQKALADAARQGFQGVLSNGYYIDLMQPASQHYAVDPIAADTTLTAEEQKRILGGEATMWSEWVSPETIDSRIWTRTAAIAERFWSPREVNQIGDMYRRLAVVDIQLEELGLTHRKNQAMMLRRLVSSHDISALQTLVSIIEPVKEYRRYNLRKQTMLSPLTGLIDAAQADAPNALIFNRAVEELISGNSAENAEKIRLTLTEWRAAQPKLAAQVETAAALSEAKMLVANWQNINAVGLEAVSYLEKNETPPAEWRDATLKTLSELTKPQAALEFAIAPGVRMLVVAAAEMSKLKNASASERREKIRSIAFPKPASKK
ncbi:MAG: Beta-N-acetylhexosaminidase [Acidobacteria bacterium]|nr:Beta-N-acetylhexosaminidase [Acidobacteriota bacterium]